MFGLKKETPAPVVQAQADPDDSSRLVRIETRLTKLMVALGVNPYQPVQTLPNTVDVVNGEIEVASTDVTLQQVLRVMCAKDTPSGNYPLRCKGVRVATIHIGD